MLRTTRREPKQQPQSWLIMYSRPAPDPALGLPCFRMTANRHVLRQAAAHTHTHTHTRTHTILHTHAHAHTHTHTPWRGGMWPVIIVAIVTLHGERSALELWAAAIEVVKQRTWV